MLVEILETIGISGTFGGLIELALLGLAVKAGYDLIVGMK